MATVNLGSIKFKWQGAYNGATAYTIDDVVSYNGSSYICKLASTGNLPTNTTYFDQMSSAGTNGTDLTTTLTTQGDILYRDGSGLQRLGAGTAGQVLQTGGAGANPSWGTLSSDWVKVTTGSHSGGVSLIFDNLDFTTYRQHKIVLTRIVSESTQGTLFARFRYDNSGTQTDYSSAEYLYRLYGKYNYTTEGDANETSGTVTDSKMRLEWFHSRSASNTKVTTMELDLYDFNQTTTGKHMKINTLGNIHNVSNEFGYYVNGFGLCRHSSTAFNGIHIYDDTYNFSCQYVVYGLK